MGDDFGLERFVQAQDLVWPTVCEELGHGRKQTHWMWFIFPQLAGLGRSTMAQRYAIRSLAEARAYLAHATLGPRLLHVTGLVNAIAGRSAWDVFGSPDDLKFHACITLFHRAQGGGDPFETALMQYFTARPHAATLSEITALDR